MTAATAERTRRDHGRTPAQPRDMDPSREAFYTNDFSGKPHQRTVRRTPSITDGIEDLLALLDERRRHGMIIWLAVWYYDGWRPGHGEVTDLVAVELGALSVDECCHRQRHRQQGKPLDEIPVAYLRRSAQMTKRRVARVDGDSSSTGRYVSGPFQDTAS